MLSREPFDLHKFIIFYNVYQILACASYMKVLVSSGVEFWGVYCPETWYMDPELQYNIGWYGFWLKASEMIETFVFLLRKKNDQVSNLHVFHHCITVTFLYFSVAYDFSELFNLKVLRKWNFSCFRKWRIFGALHQLIGSRNHVLLLLGICLVQGVQSSQDIQTIHHNHSNYSIFDCPFPAVSAQGFYGMPISDLLHCLLHFWLWSIHCFLFEFL